MPLPEIPPRTVDARLFVRDSDGESFIVPKEINGHRQLSFRLYIVESKFGALKQAVHEDEDYGLNDFEPQFYLGSKSLKRNTSGGLINVEAHGYLAQIWPGRNNRKYSNEHARDTLAHSEMLKVARSEHSIDVFDRQLALLALQRFSTHSH